VQLRHEIVYEIYFSVYGIDDHGKKMTVPGPGAMRLMRRKKAIFIPSVS
jgi:hypothetical protein